MAAGFADILTVTFTFAAGLAGATPLATVTAASETPRSAVELDIAETHSASDLVAVIADTRSL